MKLKEKTPCLFLKLANYKKYDYIEEHQKTLNENGSVWILKIGREINKEFIRSIIEKDGGIILKTPARINNKYYYCKLINNKPTKEIVYPKYYDEYLKYEGYNFEDTLKNENWFEIDSMEEMDPEDVEKIVIIKTQNKIVDCLKSRAVFMYVENCEEIN